MKKYILDVHLFSSHPPKDEFEYHLPVPRLDIPTWRLLVELHPSNMHILNKQ
jgi:hypothetical protein